MHKAGYDHYASREKNLKQKDFNNPRYIYQNTSTPSPRNGAVNRQGIQSRNNLSGQHRGSKVVNDRGI
ncbi:hypothetical protein C4D60_Mb00t13980 [Musa balbisiana]|uniref:Uncharacterized protein n=1 Tax=Musa balbisiana TaxID=52838 RepID=A0A4S8I489_MUSBA|nr:hypothetical protein C4D60_Mb00t13980 [Musa balbisiana]